MGNAGKGKSKSKAKAKARAKRGASTRVGKRKGAGGFARRATKRGGR